MRIGDGSQDDSGGRATGLDLHLHSNISDGVLSDIGLVDLVRQSGVGVAAITDHDSIGAAHDQALVQHLSRLGARAPQIVPGVEIGVWLDQPVRPGYWQEAHIVGLGCDPANPKLRAALIRQRLSRYARVRACVERLRADGFALSFADVGFTAGLQAPTSWHIGKALADRGYAKDPDTASRELVTPRYPSPAEMPEAPILGSREAIQRIRAAGGVAVLAHPHRNAPAADPQAITDLFAKLKAEGLDAVETYRVDLPADHRPLYEAAARTAGLLTSGGTDFHGAGENPPKKRPGDAGAPASLWPPLEQLIRARGGITDVRQVRLPLAPQAGAAERMLFAQHKR